MGFRYRTGERVFGGSMVERFNPEFGGDRLNTRLGPERPSPLVRETSSGLVRENGNSRRRRLIGLSARLDRDEN